MTPEGIAPPEPEACLARPYPSSQKGGTIVGLGRSLTWRPTRGSWPIRMVTDRVRARRAEG